MTQDAIKLAIEKGGYHDHVFVIENGQVLSKEHNGKFKVLLDPAFWQALGKALQWEDCRCEGQCGSVYPEYVNGCVRCGKSVRADRFYIFHARHYLEALLTEGQSKADEYLTSLLQ